MELDGPMVLGRNRVIVYVIELVSFLEMMILSSTYQCTQRPANARRRKIVERPREGHVLRINPLRRRTALPIFGT